MNALVLRKTILFFLLILSLLFSCKENSRSVDLLVQAQSIIDKQPAEALTLLDSIKNPEDMGKDYYMQFIVAYTGAKLKTDKDVTNENLIIEAQKYFSQKDDPENAAQANFYIGSIYRDKGIFEKAMINFLEAEKYAKQSSNDLLAGKSMHNVGFLYFERGIMDSAIVSGKSALSYYRKSKDVELLKSHIFNSIGRAYEAVGNLDSAYVYFSQGLDLSKKIAGQSDEAIFTYNLGAVLRQQKEYNKAKECFDKALTLTTSTIDSIKIYLNLSKLYNTKVQLDSAKYYTDLIKGRLPEINDNYTLESVYGALSDYNRESGNLREAKHYEDLRQEVENKINAINNSQRLLDTEREYQLSLLLKEKEMDSLRIRSYLYKSVGAFFIVLITLIALFINRNSRSKHIQEREKHKLLDQKLESFLFLRSIYQNLVTDWGDIEKKVKAHAGNLMTKENPPLYIRIRQMVGDIKNKTNRRLLQDAKDFLKKEPFGEQALVLLEDKELLVLMLTYYGYNKKEIALIVMDLLSSHDNIHVIKLDIARKLRRVGMAEERINEILFPDMIQ